MAEEIKVLKDLLSQRDKEILRLRSILENKNRFDKEFSSSTEKLPITLSQDEVSRYSRQLILPEIGVSGQIALKQAAVLIVGAGGLGCPVGIYLAAAGVGNIGIVDHDIVDVSNLHRQIAHTSSWIGEDKSKSLKDSIKEINPDINCSTYQVLLKSTNIEKIIQPYSIIVDASDNVPTRYLLNDAAVLYNKHLVSGSALRFEGQLTVYNYLDGPCYRCLFPKPPPANTVTNCSEGGVLGIITGVIGCLQALEVIKIAIGLDPSYYKKMLLFDGLNGDIRIINLRNKKIDCAVCGKEPTIKELIDYEEFCNTSATDNNVNVSLLADNERVSCAEYKQILDSGAKHILLDVRPTNEIAICNLPNSVNVPINEISFEKSVVKLTDLMEQLVCDSNFIICRRGNDSQRAVLALQSSIPNCKWRDIKGGLYAWHDEIDSTFPKY